MHDSSNTLDKLGRRIVYNFGEFTHSKTYNMHTYYERSSGTACNWRTWRCNGQYFGAYYVLPECETLYCLQQHIVWNITPSNSSCTYRVPPHRAPSNCCSLQTRLANAFRTKLYTQTSDKRFRVHPSHIRVARFVRSFVCLAACLAVCVRNRTNTRKLQHTSCQHEHAPGSHEYIIVVAPGMYIFSCIQVDRFFSHLRQSRGCVWVCVNEWMG